MVIGLGVVDAPMVGVRLTDAGTETEILPWVRVVRHQPYQGDSKVDRNRVFGIDIVHKEFLGTYVETHVKPFAEEFSRLALKHAHELADARGFVPSMGENSWTDIEGRLQPASFGTGRKRAQAVLKRIAGIFSKGK